MSNPNPNPNPNTIIESVCRQFEQDWNAGHRRRIEDCLAEADPSDSSDLLLRLLQSEIQLRSQSGDTPQPEEYRSRFAQHTKIVQQAFETTSTRKVETPSISLSQRETITAPPLSAGDIFSRFTEDEQSVQTTHAAADDLPRQFGDYELLKELGRGGMGIVYLARQRSTDRRVALKLIRPDQLKGLPLARSRQLIERFQTEARAAAQLDHDHLVTIFEVGEIEGRHYFSMKYVEGKSLAEHLLEGPIGSRDAAEWLSPAARAVEEAHSRGILHRDLKPQNILIEAKTGRALVTDFGLAKLTTEQTDLTQSGEVMGTPQYMSPEQAQDSTSVTAQTDVYALGTTLYHMMTGHPPFQAATALETLRMVIDREPVRPQQLNPSIDRDLETICLKCLEKEPEKRYETAGLLADELDRYLAGKPILARPVGWWGRSCRWARRNKTVAALLASTVTFFAATFVAVLVGYFQTTAAFREVEAGSRRERASINRFFTMVSEETLLNQPGSHPLRKELLTQALQYYQQFLEDRKDDPTIQDDVAETYFRVGRITLELGSPQESLTWLDKARTIQQRLAGKDAEAQTRRFKLGNTLNLAGEACIRLEDWGQAEETLNAALQVRSRLAGEDPADREYQRTLANTHMNLGLLKRRIYRREDSKQAFDEAKRQMLVAQTIREQLLERNRDDSEVLRDFSKGAYNLANLLSEKMPDESRQYLTKALESCEKILALDDSDFANRYLLALCLRRLGDLTFSSFRDETAAFRHYQQARQQLEFLSYGNPKVDEYKSLLAGTYINLSHLEDMHGSPDEILKLLKSAEAMLLDLKNRNPQTSRYGNNLKLAQQRIADLQQKRLSSASEQSNSK